MAQPGQARAANDLLTNIALGGIVAVAAVAGVLRLAGSVVAFLTGVPQPMGGLASGFGVLTQPLNPGGPLGTDGLNPVLYWVVVIVILGALTAVGVVAWRAIDQARTRSAPHKLAGTTSPAEVARVASPRTLISRASTLRPSLAGKVPASEVGYLLRHQSHSGRQARPPIESNAVRCM